MSPIAVPLGILRAGVRQALADLRPQFLSAGVVSVVLPVMIVVLVARTQADVPDAGGLSFGSVLAAGAVGSFSALAVIQIANEAYQDRAGGALLRVRILPHGPMVWAVGKTISCVVTVLVTQCSLLLAASLLIDGVSLDPADALLSLLALLLASLAVAPIGFLVASVARSAYGLMATTAGVMALLVTSGFAIPMTQMPLWLQRLQYGMPFYWAGHLSRWLLVGLPAWEPGGRFQPVVAIGVLAAWAVVGFAVVPFIIRRSVDQETIGSLSRMQAKIRRQTGM
ncbi:ABC transporter permease [Actinomyces capricornis]|uniref:Transport permease protein n=1 Tax=Actinomyces capricornis TaxID=2755559 RepID=A0ABN6K9P9_9ACTO|nr:ABC transporter permease [Actinomyces capricornis]BDA65337.1 transport permease protein [Actinomyces capricornis]